MAPPTLTLAYSQASRLQRPSPGLLSEPHCRVFLLVFKSWAGSTVWEGTQSLCGERVVSFQRPR